MAAWLGGFSLFHPLLISLRDKSHPLRCGKWCQFNYLWGEGGEQGNLGLVLSITFISR